jgi:thiamine biosynthesis protein ThiS
LAIDINVNGELRAVASGLSIAELLRSLDLHPGMVVVEHNGEIIRRERYDDIPVAQGDTLELVHFVGGG